MFNYQDIEQYKADVQEWTRKSKGTTVNTMNALNIQHYPYSRNPEPLAKALRVLMRLKGDLPSKVVYRFPKSAVYVAKGVSRGHPISNPRQAKDWLNASIDKDFEELGDIVAEHTGDMIVNALMIK